MAWGVVAQELLCLLVTPAKLVPVKTGSGGPEGRHLDSSRSERDGNDSGGLLTARLAVGEFGFEVSDGDVVEQDFGGIAQAVVDEADVGTPALVADDGVEFILPRLNLPES